MHEQGRVQFYLEKPADMRRVSMPGGPSICRQSSPARSAPLPMRAADLPPGTVTGLLTDQEPSAGPTVVGMVGLVSLVRYTGPQHPAEIFFLTSPAAPRAPNHAFS